MKIGVWLNEECKADVGGAFSYQDRLIKAIDSYKFSSEIEICFVTRNNKTRSYHHKVIQLQPQVVPSFKQKLQCRIPLLKRKYIDRVARRLGEEKKRQELMLLQQEKVAFLFYPTQAKYEIEGFPFVAMNWDVGHLSSFPFPEVVGNGDFIDRNHYYRNVLPQALLICCESDSGKQELVKYLCIDEKKIRVVPLFPGECVNVEVSKEEQKEVMEMYGLEKNRYFFYPAQFCAHKNHINLMRAFAQFGQKNHDYKLVLTGSDKGTMDYVKNESHSLGIDDKVVFTGFITVEQINALYKNATSLVMPSYIGPTNMPLLEAMELGCPVIATDFSGHREELGAAACYFNAISSKEICNAMENMISNRDEYLAYMEEVKKQSKFTLENAMLQLDKAFEEAVVIRSSWDY